MRISRIQLAGLAVALAGGVAQEAAADDLTISTATTTPVVTSNANNGSAGDVTITSAGSITLTTGQTGVTIDSNNDPVANAGVISSNNANNTIGILITNGFTGAVTNTGTISLVEDNEFADTDSDGDVEGAWAIGTDRHGIRQIGNFTGDITNDGSIVIEAIGATGISINGTLTGNLGGDGDISVRGDNAVGILIEGAGVGVTGDVNLLGSITARGENASAVRIDSAIGGELNINGNYVSNGFPSTTVPADQSDLDPADDLLIGGATIHVRDSVGGGITVLGIGVENDDDDDGDTISDETDSNDDLTAQISSFGSSPAILVQADGVNITLGPTDFAGNFGFYNRGAIAANGVFDNFDATAVRFEGIGGSTIDTGGGIANDRSITAQAREADAYAISIGDGVLAPLVRNRLTLLGSVLSEGSDTAYGLYIEGGTVQGFENTGTVTAQLGGEVGDARAIYVGAGNLAATFALTNSGTIAARVIATDSDLSDDIVPVAAGDAVAIDMSAYTGDVTLEQIADQVEPDDDGNDDDADDRPDVLIEGDIILGVGNDTFNLEAGEVQGDLEFGAGTDTFLVDLGASFTGALSDADGDLAITVNDGLLDLRGGDINGEVNIASASFGTDSVLRVQLDGTPANSTLIQASGVVTFTGEAAVVPIAPVGLPAGDTIVFLTANQLFGGALVVDPEVTGAGVPFVYNMAVELTNPMALDGAANGLQAVFGFKSAAQLGLNLNQETAFDPIINALRLDPLAAAAFTALDNQAAFDEAYDDLMPSFSSAAAELAATAIQQAQGASGNRLAATRLQGIDEVSVWAQEIGYYVSRTPPSLNGQEFTGYGFGMAIGIDGPLENGGLFGLSASFITSEVEEEGRPEGEISTTLGQVGAYLGTAVGIVDLDFVAGVGVGQMNSQRYVQIGEDFEAISEAEWWAYEGHGMARASVPLSLGGSFVITPQAALTYVFLAEDGYTEEGGGAAIDYEVDSTTSQRLWGDVGVELSARFRMRGETVIAPRLFAGYRTNIIDEEAERDFRFVSTGDEFTLTDEGFGDGGALVGIGVDATNGYSTFTLGYEGEYGDQIERHSINASVRFRF